MHIGYSREDSIQEKKFLGGRGMGLYDTLVLYASEIDM
jgi:hypothetical protein